MKVVLDEPLPRKLASLLTEAGCPTDPFPSAWKGLKDSTLLDEVDAGGWQVLITCDRNMAFQQTLARRTFALVVVPGQRLQHLTPMVDAIARAAATAEPGTVLTISIPSGARIPGVT